jgi:hypothetical protein
MPGFDRNRESIHMNRHQRRAAAATGRRANTSTYYQDYVRHLPQVPVDAPLERGRVDHLSFLHDDWCRWPADCNCDVEVVRHVEPRRS